MGILLTDVFVLVRLLQNTLVDIDLRRTALSAHRDAESETRPKETKLRAKATFRMSNVQE
jgi:hypothetical protein